MTRRDLLLVAGFLAATALLVVALGQRAIAQARADALTARQHLQTTNRQLASLTANDTLVTQASDPLDLARRALLTAGLPQSALQSVRPQGTRELDNGSRRRQTVTIRLAALDMPALGSWMAAWHQADGAWHIQDIQCNRRRQGTAIDHDDGYDILMTCFIDTMNE